MNRKYYVYAYWRLDINEIFYIGKGYGKRWRELRKRNPHFNNILNKHKVAVTILKDNLTEEEAFYWEEKIIEVLVFEYGYSIDIPKNRGDKQPSHLVNMTWGGEGASGHNSREGKTEEELREHDRKLSINHSNVSGRNHPQKRAVICLTTKRLFATQQEGENFYNCKNINKCCKNVRKHAGRLKDGTRLKWKYINWNHGKYLKFKEVI